MRNKFEYAIETLKIEKYKMIALHRQIEISEHEARTSFAPEIKEVEEKLKQIETAIKKLEI